MKGKQRWTGKGFTDILTLDQLWDEIEKLGVIKEQHESDLYLVVTPATQELIKRYEFRSNVTTFCSEGRIWYDIPFGYRGFWETVAKARAKATS